MLKKLYNWIKFKLWLRRLLFYSRLALRVGTVRQIEKMCDVWIELGTAADLPHIIAQAQHWKDNASAIVTARVFKRGRAV